MRAVFTCLVLAGLLISWPSRAALDPRLYAADAGRDCDGFPRTLIETPPGLCVGLVAGPPEAEGFAKRRLRMPRSLLQIGPDVWLISDMGGWDPGRGAVWQLKAAPGGPAELTRLLSGLNLPHGLGRGPDGGIYVAESTRIFRFDPAAPDPAATVETVLDGLPGGDLAQHRHPLKAFLFEPTGALVVSVGAPSDQCERRGADRCAEGEGAAAQGVIRRYAYVGAGRWSADWTVAAAGLRNGLALARSPSGLLLEGENSIDLPGEGEPYDELNVIQPGRWYGWPYCIDLDRAAPAWAGSPAAAGCAGRGHARPALLLPAHSAPLGMAYYQGAMFPQLKGRLIVGLHGYRDAGGWLVAYGVDAKGVPLATKSPRFPVYEGGVRARWRPFPPRAAKAAAEPMLLTRDWSAAAGRPRGSPVGVTVARDGAIWMADDHNGAILRLAADRQSRQ